MISVCLHDLETLFGWLLAASWQASVLALLVLGLQWMLRGRLNPRWRYALWLLVLARLVLPALPESALSLFQFAPPPPTSLVVPVTEPLFVQAILPSPQIDISIDISSLEPSHPFSAYSLFAIIWLLGAVSLLILTWQVNRRFARQVANSPEITDPELLESFAAAKKELGIRRAIRLIESGQVQSPAIMGLFQPTLLLPADVRDKFDARELRFIFLHELAHLKRGDVIVQGLIALLQILHWFNPVLWFAFRRMRIDREPATDALVLSRTGEEEKERYGLMLIKLLEHFNQRHSLPTLVGILEDKDQFKRRFSLIARFTRGAYGWSLLGVLLIGVLAVACLTKSKVTQPSDTNGPILGAIQLDDTATLQKFIDHGVDPKQVTSPSGSLLIDAKSPQAVEILLNHGLDPNARTGDGETPLSVICAAQNRNVTETVGILRVLLKHGADPNARVGKFNNTPLMLAYAVPVIDLLVENGADPKAVNKDGEGALAVHGPWTMDRVEALIRHGVPFDPGKDGPDILVPACMSDDAPLVKWLLEHGVAPNAPGVWHRDNTEVLKMLPLVAADGNVTLENAKLLLDHGAKADRVAGVALLNEAGPHEAGPIVGQRAVNFIELLRSRDPHFISELCYQISRNAPLADLQKLLDQGSPADPPEDKVITPLGEAALLGNMDAVKLLIARHADPNGGGIENPEYPNQTHTTPLWLATRRGHDDIVKYLLSHGAKPDSEATATDKNDAPKSDTDTQSPDANAQMLEVVQKGDAATLQKLIDQGVDPKTVKSGYPTLLFEAGSPQVAEILIAHGVDVNARDTNEDTLSHFCASGLSPSGEKDRAEIIRVLLKHGANPNAPDSLGYTPIVFARDGATVDALVEFGAKVNIQTKEGRDLMGFDHSSANLSYFQALERHGYSFAPDAHGSQLLVAASHTQNLEVMKWLLDRGVDPNTKGIWVKSNEGTFYQLPLQTAAVFGNTEAARLLISHGAKADEPMITALHNGYGKIVKLFWESGVRNISELCYKVSQGVPVGDLQKLLDQGIPADPPQDKLITPLGVAAMLGNMDAVKLLVAHNADVNAGRPINPKLPQYYRMSPLIMASGEGQDEIVDYLLKHGATPDPAALWQAAENSHPYPSQRSKDHFEKTVRILIDAGALKTATPELAGMILAASIGTRNPGGNTTVLKMLLDAGLSPELPLTDEVGKQTSVIGYYRDWCIKNKDNITDIKPLLDMLEAADKGAAAPAVSPTPTNDAAASQPAKLPPDPYPVPVPAPTPLRKAIDAGSSPSTANAQMLEAVQKGDVAILQKLLAQGIDPKTIKDDQDFVQQVIAKNPSDLEQLQSLCKLAADHGEIDEYALLSEKIKSLPGQSDWHLDDGTLLAAVARGDRPLVQAIIDQGWDLNKYSVMRLSGAAAQSPGMRDWLVAKGIKIPEFSNGERLIDAADREDIPEMERLLKTGVDINYQGESGWTPITKASEANKVQSVKFLLAHGADPNSTKSPGYNYSGMCLTGKPEIANMLLAAGGNINATLFNRGVHIIDYPITFGPAEMVKWFIAHGVDPTKVHPDDPYPTFLFEAANPEIAELLIQHGVDVNAREKGGQTALMKICGYANKPAETARVLLKHGADPNAHNDYGATPLMWARDGATVDVLVEYGADLKAKNKDGMGILEQTPITADASRLDALIRHGVPFDPKTDGPGMLLNAIGGDQLDLMAYLLNHGVDPNQKAEWLKGSGFFDHVKPLLRAVISNRYDAVKLLLDHGAQVDDEMFFALAGKKAPMVKLFWDSGAHRISELCYRISQNAPASELQSLLEKGAPANPPEDKIITPLGEAARMGKMEMVQLLVEHGADVNAGGILNPQYPQFRMTPLQQAASEGQDEIVKYLLDHGAQPDPWAVVNASGHDKAPFEQIVRRLIAAGALKNITPEIAGAVVAAPIRTWVQPGNPPDPAILKLILEAGLSPESPMPDTNEYGEKPNTVIGYFREASQKYKNDPSFGTLVPSLKPMLDLLEAADKGAGTKPSGAAAPAADPASPNEAAASQPIDPYPVPVPAPTPLRKAIDANQVEEVKSLLDHGAEIYSPDVEEALSFGRKDIVKLLWDHGARYCSELAYAINQDEPIGQLEQLLNKGMPADREDQVITPLGVAAQKGNMATAQLLVKRGAETHPTNTINNPLIWAAQQENPEMVDFLLKNGAQPDLMCITHTIANSMDYPDEKPKEGAAKTMELLIQAGGLKKISESDAAFLLVTAADHKNLAILKQLLDAGLSPQSKQTDGNAPGKTAIEIVREEYARPATDEPYNKNLEPMLDLLEAADKSAGTKSSGAAAPPTDPASPNGVTMRQPADEVPDFFASYPAVPLVPGEPLIQISLQDKNGGSDTQVPARAFARGGVSSEAKLGGALNTTTDCDYVVDKDVKFIKARFIIHSVSGANPARISIDLPITTIDAVKSIPIGDGFSATAVLLEPTKLLPPAPPAKTGQTPSFCYQTGLGILTIPAQLRDRFQTLQKSGHPMDILKEPNVRMGTETGGGLFPDQPPQWLHTDEMNFVIQASSATPDVIYLKGIFDSTKYDTFFPLGDHFQVFAVGKTHNGASNDPSSSFFNVLVVRAEETKPGVPMRKLPEY